MPQHQSPWDTDGSRTQKGVAPVGLVPTSPPTAMPPKVEPHVRYRLGSRLGGTGQVYEAQSDAHSGPVAVKLFPFAVGLAPTAVAAFTREATRVADLRHPHIVQVMRTGTFADGTPFAVTERLFGQTLEERIGGRGALPVSELMPFLRGIASALAAAHTAGVVHRELRADNVFIANLAGYESGFAKVLDFGVSRLTAAARAAGRIVGPGTVGALAPEQRQGSVETGDERADQFSLAVLTHRLVTGTEAAPGMQGGPGFERMPEGRSGRERGVVRSPPGVEAVLAKAMSQRPENRFESVDSFFRAMEEAFARAGSVVTPIPVASAVVGGGGIVAAMGYVAPVVAARPVAAPAVTSPRISALAPGTGEGFAGAAAGAGAGGDPAPQADESRAGVPAVREDGPTAPALASDEGNESGGRQVGGEDQPTVQLRLPPRTDVFPGAAPRMSSNGTSTGPRQAGVRDRAMGAGAKSGAAANSLTQQFFVDGDRHEATQWVDSPLIEQESVHESPDHFDSFDHVPKRRTPFILAASLCLVGLAVTAWAAGWLGGGDNPPASRPQPVGAASVASQPVPSSPLPTTAPAVQPPTAVAARPPSPPSPPPPPAPPTGAAMENGVSGPDRRAPITPKTAAENLPPPSPSSRPLHTTAPVDRTPTDAARARPLERTMALPPRRPSDDGQQIPSLPPPTAGERTGALRGYSWSEKRRRLMRSSPAAVPTDSGPPPPWSPTPSPNGVSAPSSGANWAPPLLEPSLD